MLGEDAALYFYLDISTAGNEHPAQKFGWTNADELAFGYAASALL